MRTLRLRGSSGSTSNDVATQLVSYPIRIRAVEWHLIPDTLGNSAALVTFAAQLSTSSSGVFTANDDGERVISEVWDSFFDAATSGLGMVRAQNYFAGSIDFRLLKDQAIHLHTYHPEAQASWTVTAIISYERLRQ